MAPGADPMVADPPIVADPRVVVLTVAGGGIARGGLDTYVAALQRTAAFRARGDVRFHAIPPDPRYLRDAAYDADLGRLLAGAEVIHANDAFAGQAALLRKGRARLVTAFHLLGSAYYRPHVGPGFAPAITETELRVVAGSDRLVAVSGSMARSLARLGAAQGRISVVPNGTDAAFLAAPREARGGGPLRLLFCGRLVAQKGAQLLPALLRGLAGQPWPWRLEVVGEGPLEGPLRMAARRIGVARRVRFSGWRAHREMPARFGAADATLSLTRYEPFGLFALESIAAGTPVVGTVVDGMREFCRPGVNAMEVPPGPGVVAASLHALEALWRGGGRFPPAALRESVADFTWERTAERLAGVYARP